ncbi:GLPGLI family protein [Psychroflexus sp. MES1-P1E]|uniref:GLPGLI family protein n=1 Tax=Psychroflexus sp. MES1-P1E TaxID=2058320 RepID=UPI000C7E5E0A|nr:GLPGLI family protein [Psychroflexus sp. MES1-P1E]PKG41601.1 GLPGLI family protein [Psychroflexus sp. MES1-P1E]
MIQKFILAIVLLILTKIEAQTQYELSHKFTYLLTYQPDSTVTYNKQSGEMFLLTSENSSVFQSKNGYLKDSLLLAIENDPNEEISMADISRFPKTQFHSKILKKNSKDSIIVYDKIVTDNFKYLEYKGNIKWKISSDTQTINGLKCQKATTSYGGRDYEAWFSDEIPISDGPYKFSGLPGLIIKISDSKKHYVFELISKSKIDLTYTNLEPKKNLFFTTKSVFFDRREDFKENIIERIAQSGFIIDDKYKADVRRKLKKRNNPIELE